MLYVFRFLRGFLRIRVTGFAPERFMNLCSTHGILLWDITPCGECYEMTVALPDYYRLRPILKKTRTRAHILEKTGFPFVAFRWRKRKIFLAGFLFCLAFLLYLSTFLWAIDVEGNEQLTREMLMEFLEDRGIAYGTRKRNVDIDGLEKALRSEYPFITWTSSRVEGTRLVIAVKENDIKTGEAQGDEESADLIADTDGVVERMITRQGVPLVKAGEEVQAGDVLISGDVHIVGDDGAIVSHRLVRADGDVLVKSTRSYTDYLGAQYQTKDYTGEIKNTYSVTALGHTMQLFHRPTSGMYRFVSTHKQLKILDDFYLPLYYEKKSYSEYVLRDVEYTEAEAVDILKKNLRGFCEDLEQKGVQILEKNVKIRKDGKRFLAQGSLTVLTKANRFATVQFTEENSIGE